MVWIYGGGFTDGYKTSSGNPAGLIAQSQVDGQEGVIYVAINYRGGLFVSVAFEGNLESNLTQIRAGWQVQVFKRTGLPMLVCTIKDLHLIGFSRTFIYSAETQIASQYLERVLVQAQFYTISLLLEA